MFDLDLLVLGKTDLLPPHPWRQPKFPSGKKQYGKYMCKMILYDFYGKIENGTKMFASCSIRRVGPSDRFVRP